jgi:DNA polymerase V
MDYDVVSLSELPLISCGFPSPAADFQDRQINLNDYLIKHPTATFFARASGQSLIGAGIGNGDLMIIDRSLEPRDGRIAVCYLDGEFTAKRIKITGKQVWLIPENESYKPLLVKEDNDLVIWGIVTHIIKAL